MKYLFTCFLLLLAGPLLAADSLQVIRNIPVNARLMSVDELGNVYVVRRKDNTLIRYTAAGDSSTNFKSIANGDITYIDVTNPLRILVYYPDFAKLVLLDRMLTVKNELNLRQLNILNSNAVGLSADGNLWVYDQFNFTLNKLDLQLNYIIKGNDLRQQLADIPSPVYLTERDRKVYMCDPAQGIMIFDQYGSYMNTLLIKGVQQLQVVENQLIYYRDHALHAYHMLTFEEAVIDIPAQGNKAILQAALCRNVLYVLYEDRLALYRLMQH